MDALRSPVSAGLSREEDTTACSYEEEMRGRGGRGGVVTARAMSVTVSFSVGGAAYGLRKRECVCETRAL